MSSKLFERHFKEETGLNIRYGDLARNDYGKPMAVGDYYFNISRSKKLLVLGDSRLKDRGKYRKTTQY